MSRFFLGLSLLLVGCGASTGPAIDAAETGVDALPDTPRDVGVCHWSYGSVEHTCPADGKTRCPWGDKNSDGSDCNHCTCTSDTSYGCSTLACY